MPAGPSEGMVLADADRGPGRVAADLLTQAEHGPDSPALLVTTDAALADAVEAEIAAGSRRARAATSSSRLAGRARPDRARAGPRRRPSPSSTTTRPSTSRSTSSRSRPTVAATPERGLAVRRPLAPESAGDYATGANHVLPTGGLARACGALAVETFGKLVQVQRDHARGPRRLRRHDRALAEAEGLHAHRDAVEIRFERDLGRRSTDEPEPVAVTSPTVPPSTAGRRPNEQSPSATACPVDDPAVRPQHLARAAGASSTPARRGPFEPPLSRVPAARLPPADRGRRRRYGVGPTRSSSGAGADEILDMIAKTFLPTGGRPSSRSRPMPCTGCSASSAAPRSSRVPRRPAAEGWAHRRRRRSARPRAGDRRLALQPEQPDRPGRARRRRSRRCSTGSPTTPRPTAEPPSVVVDEAYASSSGDR